MKSIMFSLLFLALRLHAQTDQPALRLSGIINLPDLKKAVLQTENETIILAEGEAEESYGIKTEMVKLDFKRETAEVCTNKIFTTLNLNFQGQTNHADRDPTILFERADFDAVLGLYSTFLGRTLLRHPLLRETDFTFSVRALNRGDAIRAIENALAEKGITFIPDGDVFAMLMPKEIASKTKAGLFKHKSHETNNPDYYQFNFPNIPFVQAADEYARFFKCKFKVDQQFPPANCTSLKLRTMTGLSKEEAIYAFDTLFRWAGIKIVPAGQGLMHAIPVAKKE